MCGVLYLRAVNSRAYGAPHRCTLIELFERLVDAVHG
jgi:hypothetical protein